MNGKQHDNTREAILPAKIIDHVDNPAQYPAPVSPPAPVGEARPVIVADVTRGPLARPMQVGSIIDQTDKCAIASAVCGFTAFIPIVSQILGLGLGVTALVNLRRARKRGVFRRGVGWAWAGILSSGSLLAIWVGLIVVFFTVGNTFSDAAAFLEAH